MLRKEILKSYSKIKAFLINSLDLLQQCLLGIIVVIVINTLVSYLKNIWGYILKMYRQNSTTTNNNIKKDNGNNNNPNQDNEDPILTQEDKKKKKEG